MEEFFVRGDAEAVEVGGAAGAALGGEGGGEFVGGEGADLGDPEGDEADIELLAGEADVAGDGPGGGAGGAPVA